MQTKLRNVMSSRKGFTLIELLVVIGILAVLAAIAIPSVAGLIDRANVSADKTNANEMTNALERFTSEYELYCQDVASKNVTAGNLDSAQGRVFNVIGVDTRAGITGLEIAQSVASDDDVTWMAGDPATEQTAALGEAEHAFLYRDTKYAANAHTMKKIVENYTKTSSATFSPKQSDCHFYYSPQCGLVVCLEVDAVDMDPDGKGDAALDALVQSGMDAKGNSLATSDVDWIDLTAYAELGDYDIY